MIAYKVVSEVDGECRSALAGQRTYGGVETVYPPSKKIQFRTDAPGTAFSSLPGARDFKGYLTRENWSDRPFSIRRCRVIRGGIPSWWMGLRSCLWLRRTIFCKSITLLEQVK